MKLIARYTLVLVGLFMLVLVELGRERIDRTHAEAVEETSRDHEVLGALMRARAEDIAASPRASRRMQHTMEVANRVEHAPRFEWVEENEASALVADTHSVEGGTLVSVFPVRVEGRITGAIRIRESLSGQREHLRNQAWFTVLRTSLLILLCAALSLGVGRWLVAKPVNALIEKARRTGRGDFEGPLLLKRTDEIGALASEIDAMCEALAIGRRKLRENEQKSRAQLEAFVRQAPLSIAMFDQGMNYLVTSGRWLTEYGRGHTDLVGRSHYDVHPDLPEPWRDLHRQVLAGATVKNDEAEWTWADGTKHWLRSVSLPWLDSEGAIGGIIISVEDITERKRAEEKLLEETKRRIAAGEELRHAERLATAGKVAAGIAHELGTPLSIIAGRAQMVASGEVTGEKAQTSARAIEREAGRIGRIVRQMLDFVRRKGPDGEPSGVADVISRTIALLEPMAVKRSVRLAWQNEGDDDRVAIDAESFQQVVTNLAANAVDAMAEGGDLTVTARAVRVAPHRDPTASPGDFIRIEVRDTGPGIPDKALDHIFEPFFTTKAPGEGTGLGLSVAYGIVEDHGGWITVDTSPKGTIFSVFLPRMGAS